MKRILVKNPETTTNWEANMKPELVLDQVIDMYLTEADRKDPIVRNTLARRSFVIGLHHPEDYVPLSGEGFGTYVAGEFITGTLEVKMGVNDIEVKELKVALKGFIKVSLPIPGEENLERAESISTTAETPIAKQTDGMSLNKKRYKFLFSFKIPDWYPPTLRDSFGSIQYRLVAQMKYSNKHFELAVRNIIIRRQVDLNLFPTLYNPTQVKEKRHTVVWYLWRGELRTALELPGKSGFIQGNHIKVWVIIENKGFSRVLKARVLLKCLRTVRIKKGEWEFHETVAESSWMDGEVGPWRTKEWSPDRFMVPHFVLANPYSKLIPTTIRRIGETKTQINTSYYLCLEMKMSGNFEGWNEFSMLPIMIGTESLKPRPPPPPPPPAVAEAPYLNRLMERWSTNCWRFLTFFTPAEEARV